MVSMEDLKLLEEIEDKMDISIASQRLENPEERTWSLEEVVNGDDLES